MLYGKVHCHDAKSTSPYKKLASLDKYATVCVPNLESSMLVSLFLLGEEIHIG
jgi:hypothetical protein